jgi:hypothetical protein
MGLMIELSGKKTTGKTNNQANKQREMLQRET